MRREYGVDEVLGICAGRASGDNVSEAEFGVFASVLAGRVAVVSSCHPSDPSGCAKPKTAVADLGLGNQLLAAFFQLSPTTPTISFIIDAITRMRPMSYLQVVLCRELLSTGSLEIRLAVFY